MGAILPPLLVVALLLVVGAVVVVSMARRQEARADRATSGEVETLRYHVPDGQDPVAVVAALQQEGFEAVTDPGATFQDVVIPCPSGRDRDRARARAVIQHAPVTLEGQHGEGRSRVRFADE